MVEHLLLLLQRLARVEYKFSNQSPVCLPPARWNSISAIKFRGFGAPGTEEVGLAEAPWPLEGISNPLWRAGSFKRGLGAHGVSTEALAHQGRSNEALEHTAFQPRLWRTRAVQTRLWRIRRFTRNRGVPRAPTDTKGAAKKLASIPPVRRGVYARKWTETRSPGNWPAFRLLEGGFCAHKRTQTRQPEIWPAFPLLLGRFRPDSLVFSGVLLLLILRRRHVAFFPGGSLAASFGTRGRGYLSSSLGFLVASPPSWREYCIECTRRPKS